MNLAVAPITQAGGFSIVLFELERALDMELVMGLVMRLQRGAGFPSARCGRSPRTPASNASAYAAMN